LLARHSSAAVRVILSPLVPVEPVSERAWPFSESDP